jgi:hypothetical protein
MSWDKILSKGLPIAIKVLREVFQGMADGASNEEIRQRVAKPDVILDEELDQLRDDEDDLLDFVKTGR